MLTSRPLANVSDINSFDYATAWEISKGESGDLYFQVFDPDRTAPGRNPAGLRYVTAVGATMVVTLQSVDSAKVVTRTASLAFADRDESIWKFAILSTDPLNGGTVTARFVLTEGTVVQTWTLPAALLVSSTGEVC